MEYVYSLTVALFLTISLIPLLIRVSARLGLVDDPSAERKVHEKVMPRTGGLGIIVGAAIPLFFLLPFDGYIVYLFIGSAIIILFGLLDDRFELNYKWKLFGQGLAAVVVMSGGIVAEQFPFFGLSAVPVWIAYPVTFFFLIGVVNGVNFSDGLDGLAAGTSIMVLLLIFALAVQSGDTVAALVSVTLVGGVLGFLRYNTFPANIFMGDSGSQFLGFVIACLAIEVTQSGTSPYSAFLPILLLGIPIMDILQVVPVRVHKKLPLPGPDKEHFHHQIGKLGFRHAEVVAIIYVLQTVLMVSAFWLRFEHDYVVAAFYAAFVIVILGALLLGNWNEWQFRYKQRQHTGTERRNRYLRRLDWYFHNSAMLLAILLGGFYVTSAIFLGGLSGWWAGLGAIILTFAITCIVSLRERLKIVYRIGLYAVSVVFAYWVVGLDAADTSFKALIAYLLVLLIALVLAVRMTRKQEFSLTTQDLLLLLVLIVLPQLPFEVLQQNEVGFIALIVALLMYASEFILNRGTRAAAFAVGCALAGMLAVFFS
ncbi:undecaprenyl/decaprenyl-phosphate alpha-N-acetylglucosaminyl 1-phosphate transferase [Halieaceae bacterium IMCC14734]|uniref:Undecaprenyl/decaprenyl-phosphate alpha-N-acetylglucosaminyl 1-phosphate transferase n=1 Tax=Candidatus Litorirhabdus singularis TaxID=2518993 RepID=A0ABT3THV0_9GAMM|nr:undecaprenyl/decaprenyl-phosphate alpha-N-acetylglucosaminyl 1-phosphate transferase [Candidatus Litorirhabdus singularis]